MNFLPGPMELILILIIVAMLFGVGKLPEVFGAVGKGIREFRKEADVDDKPAAPAATTLPTAPVVSAAPAAPVLPAVPVAPAATPAIPLGDGIDPIVQAPK